MFNSISFQPMAQQHQHLLQLKARIIPFNKFLIGQVHNLLELIYLENL